MDPRPPLLPRCGVMAVPLRSALILAGGASKRFGRAKALVEVAEKPMIVRVAEALMPLADELIVSVADAASERRLHGVLPRARIVQDARPRRGPIEGFERGFDVARAPIILVAPCDAPLLRPEIYGLLLSQLGDREAAVPRPDVIDPVRAVYRADAVRRVLREAGGALPSPSSLVDRLDAVLVSEAALRAVDPDLLSFRDVNRREDLSSVLEFIGPAA